MTVSLVTKNKASKGDLEALIEWTRSEIKSDQGEGPSAEFLLEEAKHLQLPRAFFALGEACAEKDGRLFELDMELAELWYHKALDTGVCPVAADRLGDIHVLRKLYTRAVPFYATAMAGEFEYSAFKLALMEMFALGMPKDVGAGFAHLKLLAKKGEPAARAALATGDCDPGFANTLLGPGHKLTSISDIEEYFTHERQFALFLARLDPVTGANPKGPIITGASATASSSAPPLAEPPRRYDPGPGRGAASPFAELNALIGLVKVKKSVRGITNEMAFLQERRNAGLPVVRPAQHFVFSGNPGTGKTTVARILGCMLKEIGYLPKGHVVECASQDLIGQYVGQTAPRVAARVEEAMGGVLFIDEAYALVVDRGKESYGPEAIASLLKLMEDKRDGFVVVAAGYPELMQKFVDSNPGLRSRFTDFIEFEDYTPAELEKIFLKLAEEGSYRLDPQAPPALAAIMAEAHGVFGASFANARFVRSLFEDVVKYMANRVVGTDAGAPSKHHALASLSLITASDLKEAWEEAREGAQVEEQHPPIGFHV